MEAGRLWGLNLNTAFYRTLDPQLGRWWQIDPEVEQFEAWSAYNSNLDNPISNADPEGDYCIPCLTAIGGAIIGAAVEAGTQYVAAGGDWRQIDGVDVLVAGFEGGVAASGAGRLVVGATKVVGEITKATVDINAKDGLKSTFIPKPKNPNEANHNKTVGATVTDGAFSVVGGAGAGKATGAVGKIAKKAEANSDFKNVVAVHSKAQAKATPIKSALNGHAQAKSAARTAQTKASVAKTTQKVVKHAGATTNEAAGNKAQEVVDAKFYPEKK